MAGPGFPRLPNAPPTHNENTHGKRGLVARSHARPILGIDRFSATSVMRAYIMLCKVVSFTKTSSYLPVLAAGGEPWQCLATLSTGGWSPTSHEN